MKMSSLEKVFLDKIVADSGESLVTVRSVLRATLVSVLKEVYAEYGNSDNKDSVEIEYHIPYITKLKIKMKNIFNKNEGEKTDIQINATPSIILTKEINRVFSDKSLEIEEFFKQEIALKLLHILEVDKDTIIETE